MTPQKRISTEKPSLLLPAPEPVLEMRRFYNTEIQVWVGEVALDGIEGWIGNPRTELLAEQFMANYGRSPTNEEMYHLVLADDDPKEGLKIRELAGNIYKNDVRVPIVLTHEGRLLDGNRRYYACMFLSTDPNGAPKSERRRFRQLPALILPKDTTKEVQDAIITEFNFASDFRLEWPYYVKSMRVYIDYMEHDLDKEELASKYGLPWRTLRTWIRAAELCDQFLDYHEHSFGAKQFAYRHFIMFDEMMRRYSKRLEQADFRESIFDLLLDGYVDENHRFRSSDDVIRLPEIRDNPEAWDALNSRKGTEALKNALRILEVSAYDSIPDPNKQLRRVVNSLGKLVASGALSRADEDLLEEFHEKTEQVPGAPNDPSTQIEKMIEWLDNMTAREMAELGAETLENLREALARVLKMSEAVSTLTAERS